MLVLLAFGIVPGFTEARGRAEGHSLRSRKGGDDLGYKVDCNPPFRALLNGARKNGAPAKHTAKHSRRTLASIIALLMAGRLPVRLGCSGLGIKI